MKIKLSIEYGTHWGQSIYVSGSIPQLGNWDEDCALLMRYKSPTIWETEFYVENAELMEYTYFVRENEEITNREYGETHKIILTENIDYVINDLWNALPEQKYLYTSGFRNSLFLHPYTLPDYNTDTIVFRVKCPYVKRDQELILSGSSSCMGKWDSGRAIKMIPIEYGIWQIALKRSQLVDYQEFKFAIKHKNSARVLHWEVGENRKLTKDTVSENMVRIDALAYRYGTMNWRAAGVAIPVFSLRTENSFGIGEFSDLKKLVDWAVITGQHIIQLLPVNDTNVTGTWLDSYPYNSISIFALNPIYLGLKSFPLKDQEKLNKYLSEANKLNNLTSVDYEKVADLKQRYLKDLFTESGEETLSSNDFIKYKHSNDHWLFPYACFCYLRDLNDTADFSCWSKYKLYDTNTLVVLIAEDKVAYETVRFYNFVQYLLHLQLTEIKEYAHNRSVILKGDIPIGISRQSVEAWTDPHLFNLDKQTGAPPDDFSLTGQNWGFPTYNWDEMSKDNYAWWKKRFMKMTDYFDAYRIDHILGFFRIWEIPISSVQALLGYFSPALPLTAEEIIEWGVDFDEIKMTIPYLKRNEIDELFGKYTSEVIEIYLHEEKTDQFYLQPFCDDQRKIETLLADKDDEKNNCIRNGLYQICNQVLFIRDKEQRDKFHPRIIAHQTYAYMRLDEKNRAAYDQLYEDFFYNRHNKFWREQAMKKLPELISSTDMLVCGEDLGMIPECVPTVMNELQILSLEIERMPKQFGVEFSNLKTIPYYSVCTTSTHDMSPLRSWWSTEKDAVQRYFNRILGREGIAPKECNSDICGQIINNNLNSQAMLTIFPLQDWLSLSDELKRKNPDEERINEPSDIHHYWRYRMHITLEKLLEAKDFNNDIRERILSAGRN